MSDQLNHNYHLKAEVLTPLHIGGGKENNWQKDLDFFCEQGKLRLISREKLFKQLSEQELNSLSSLMASGKLNDFNNYLHIDKKRLESVTIREFNLLQMPEQDEIIAMIRDGQGQVFVPGSSLKGAFRSILFKNLKEPKDKDPIHVFGNINQDWMRLLRVTDAYFDNTEIIHTKTFNLQGHHNKPFAGWKHAYNRTDEKFRTSGFLTTFEAVPKGSTSFLRVSLADGIYQRLSEKREAHVKTADFIKEGKLASFFKIINDHTFGFLQKEINFFETYAGDRTTDILKNLKILSAQIPKDGSSCLLRLGLGSGFHSITGDWQHDDYTRTGVWEDGPQRRRGNFKIKSRKLAFEHSDGQLNTVPMGFVKLNILSDAEYQQEMAQTLNAKETAIQKEQIRLQQAAQKAEQERIKAEAAAEAALKAKEEALKPKYFEGKIKRGSEIDAYCLGPVNPGNPKVKKFKLLIESPIYEQEVNLSYPSELDTTIVHKVIVTSISKKGKVESVSYKGKKL